MGAVMDIEDFETLALAWGADVALWPAARQGPARDLIGASAAEAGTALDEVGRLDRTLRAAILPHPSLDLRARIIAAAPRPLARFPSWRGWFGAALAASCAAGVLAGLLVISLGVFPSHGTLSGDPAVEAAGLLHASSDATEG
jgi:hypothetical protein